MGGANTKRRRHQEFRLNKNNTKYGWSLIVGPTTGIAIVIERVEYVCYKCKDSLQNTANRSINEERNTLMTRKTLQLLIGVSPIK